MVNVNPTSKYREYNDAVATPEAGGKYSTVNDKEIKIINGKKVEIIKPVDEWAIGRYQHYFVHAKAKIMDALAAEGINTSGLSKEGIAKAYRDSPKAQERVQELINKDNFAEADKLIKKYNLKAPTQEIAFLSHFLGNGGANYYLNLLKKYGYKKADEIMAYGGDPNRPNFLGNGGPKSEKANAYVSAHMMAFRESYGKVTNSNKASVTYTNTTTANNTTTNTSNKNKITAKNLDLPFDEVVNKYTDLKEGKLSGINELQYNPMGWGAKHGIKRKGQSWANHDTHVHVSFTDPQVALTIIKKAQEIGLNASENLYVGEVHDVHAHDKKTGAKTSHHYFNFDGEFDGKKLSKAVDINGSNTKLTAKQADAKMKQLYKWIHETYSF